MEEIEEFFMNELVGLDAVTIKRLVIKFRERFAKSSLYISQDLNHRNNQIIQMNKQGKSARQIAMTFRLSDRQVSNILSKAKN